MDSRKRGELLGALREKEANETLRKLAVRLVLDKGMDPAEVADMLDRDPDWVGTWVGRYTEGGLPALRDLPRPGRPPLVPRFDLYTIVWGEYTTRVSPAPLRDAIAEVTGVWYHPASVRRFLREFGFSRKRPTLVHVNRASPDEVREWQATVIPELLSLRDEGYTVLVQDESIFTNDAGRGAKHWSPVGKRIPVLHTGSHEKFVAFGALADDGRQLFRTYDWFNAATFVRYLRELYRKFGRIAIIADRAPQHRAAVVRDFLEDCRGKVLMYELPVGSPHMNAAEEPWRRAKHAVRDSEHHRSMGDLRAAVGEHFRVTRHRLDIFAYMGREAADCA